MKHHRCVFAVFCLLLVFGLGMAQVEAKPQKAPISKTVKKQEQEEEKPFILPYREDSALTVAEEMIADEKWAQALHVLEGVLKRHPENTDAFTYRGYIRYQMGERDAAVEDFKRTLMINPTHQAANMYLASVYLDEGDLPRAREQMQVLRMVCGNSDCAELNELESRMNRHRSARRAAPKADEDGEAGNTP